MNSNISDSSSIIKEQFNKLNNASKQQRDEILNNITNQFNNMKKAGNEQNNKIIVSESEQCINLLTFMKQGEDSFESEFINDILLTLEKIESEFQIIKFDAPKETAIVSVESKTIKIDLETKEFVDSFVSESSEFIEQIEPVLDNLLKSDNQETVNTIFRLFHSLKGLAGFLNFEIVKSVTHEAETLLDIFRKNNTLKFDNYIQLLYEICDFLKSSIYLISTKFTDVDNTELSKGLIVKIKKAIEELLNKKEVIKNKRPLGEILVDIGAVDTEQIEQALKVQSGEIPIGEILVQMGQTDNQTIDKALSMQNNNYQNNQIKKQDIRVDTLKLDKLFDLVGELITAEAMVINNPDLEGLDLYQFNKAANMLNKIIRELQEVTMSVRMTPLESLFNRMKRLVKDVSKKANKKIEFNISGQETEMDKNVIEEISDPLVHILRNSIDHGIELPEIRLKKGKKEDGIVNLKAKYEGNEILIVIEDDGAGINKEKLLKKAIEKEILQKSPDLMTEQEIFQLIFEAGLSTADKISDISGRGVGMDVVKRNIEKLHGTITIESKENTGTTITLRIPLTLAIMDVMLISVGNTKFSVPLLSIRETFRPNMSSITETMDNHEVIKIRNELFSVVRLHEVYSKNPVYTKLDEGILIIVESRGKKVALFIDDIIGQQQIVVKALPEYIGKVKGLMGSMVLSDGSIGLILDIDGIIELSEK